MSKRRGIEGEQAQRTDSTDRARPAVASQEPAADGLRKRPDFRWSAIAAVALAAGIGIALLVWGGVKVANQDVASDVLAPPPVSEESSALEELAERAEPESGAVPSMSRGDGRALSKPV